MSAETAERIIASIFGYILLTGLIACSIGGIWTWNGPHDEEFFWSGMFVLMMGILHGFYERSLTRRA